MNADLQCLIDDCNNEITEIEGKLQGLQPLDKMKGYLTNYTLIRCCGTIEYVYRSIVADYFSSFSIPQIHNYLESTVRSGSMGANYENMTKLLKKFDDSWESTFKTSINNRPEKNRLISSLKSLSTNRNAFAHGQSPTATFQDIVNYYNDSLIVINLFDAAVV